ncbi:MAG: YceI family protein [Prolixibacteraceae bacterium]|jgi:polyisoprenoid-binding protein YceI|nr:YceI family protein [Prolixibacteraceae bacterium]
MKTFKSLAIFVLALSLSTSVFAGTQKVDTAKSSVKWLGKKVTGEHFGSISVKEGSLEVSKGKVTGGKVVIDMTSLAVEDVKDAGMNGKLVGHLKSDDFFGVATFPTSELVVTKVDGSTFSGNLTIKGITNPTVFTATSSTEGKTTTYKGTITIDRSKYNVKYGSKSFFDNLGDKVIYDEFTLDFSLVVAE